MKVAITGHRPNKLSNDYNFTSPLMVAIRNKLQAQITHHLKPTEMISGMALGIDTLWAQLAIINKIPLLAAVPFIGQENMWPERSRKVYKDILDNPLTTIIVVCEGAFTPNKMQKRNEFMVDRCDKLIAVWDGSNGGTANCVEYAQSKMKEEDIIFINPSLLTSP